jgi:hypothetical protein
MEYGDVLAKHNAISKYFIFGINLFDEIALQDDKILKD